MQEINIMQKKRIEYLAEKEGMLQKALNDAPEGTLRINSNGNRLRFYHCTKDKEPSVTYIKKENLNLAQRLAQKDYDQRALRAVVTERKNIEEFLSRQPEITLEKTYDMLHPERQKMVVPAVETEEQFVEAWRSVKYEGNPFYHGTTEYYTAKGERVRSKSEIIIADLLEKEGIPYRYEYPVEVIETDAKRGIQASKILYPDFTVLNVRTRKIFYWEHFGMMDNLEYVQKTLKKILLYKQNDIFIGNDLIVTFEMEQMPLNSQSVLSSIRRYLL